MFPSKLLAQYTVLYTVCNIPHLGIISIEWEEYKWYGQPLTSPDPWLLWLYLFFFIISIISTVIPHSIIWFNFHASSNPNKTSCLIQFPWIMRFIIPDWLSITMTLCIGTLINLVLNIAFFNLEICYFRVKNLRIINKSTQNTMKIAFLVRYIDRGRCYLGNKPSSDSFLFFLTVGIPHTASCTCISLVRICCCAIFLSLLPFKCILKIAKNHFSQFNQINSNQKHVSVIAHG